MTENQRLKFIDVARGISIICIILGHFDQDPITRVVFTFHVPLFYLITGYFTTDKRSFGDFVKAKARTLLVPYLITALIIIVIRSIMGAVSGDMISELTHWSVVSLAGCGSPVEFGSHWFNGVGPIWFLLATFIGSVLFRALLSFTPVKRFAFVMAFFLVGYLTAGYVYLPLSIQAGLIAVLYMYLGYLYRSVQENVLSLPKEAKIVAVVFAFVIWIRFIKDFSSFWLVIADLGRGPVDILGSICACAIVLLFSRFLSEKVHYVAGFFSYFGKYSLLVMCIHCIEFKCINQEVVYTALQDRGMSFEAALIVMIMAKLIGILGLTYVLSKIKVVRRIMGYRN